MNIYFVRHGETEENIKKTYYGNLDSKLTFKGIQQAKLCGKFLEKIDFEKIFISEKLRTFETAQIIFPNKKFIIDSRINELNFGIFEGKTYDELTKLYPKEVSKWKEDWKDFCPKNGESYITFYSRVKSFIDYIKKLNDKNILIVTHGGVVRAAYSYILDENLDFYWKFASKNGDISIVKYEYGNFFIDSIMHVGGVYLA